MSATQLGLDLTPVFTVAVGDRVRLLRDGPGPFAWFHAGQVGTVTSVRRPPGPADDGWWNPVSVLLDGDEPGREYAFDHEDLELVEARA